MSFVNRCSLGARRDRSWTAKPMVGRRAAAQIMRAFLHRDKLGEHQGREHSSVCETYDSRRQETAAGGGCRAVQ